ncbi:unnamed protein product [Arabis nemorensis]|uniref:Reverse transcriptase zinc-binding domain-containing protein n=1 Tax=Arabis nemorensis TaxID=586526 RepID=A0A565AT67_9BRAS|nr:unnamed protein product [Arabis nemorensis]
MGHAPFETNDLTVVDPFQHNTSEWGKGKIEAVLPLYDPDIMSIKPSQIGAPDKLVWLRKSTGDYTTKTGYFTSLEEQKTEEDLRRTTGIDWITDVWKQNVSPKLKLFLWKVANKALPVGERLVTRHILVDPLCKCCGEVESINHMFFQCDFSQRVWRGAPFSTDTESGTWMEYEAAWEKIKTKLCLPPTGLVKGPLSP